MGVGACLGSCWRWQNAVVTPAASLGWLEMLVRSVAQLLGFLEGTEDHGAWAQRRKPCSFCAGTSGLGPWIDGGQVRLVVDVGGLAPWTSDHGYIR